MKRRMWVAGAAWFAFASAQAEPVSLDSYNVDVLKTSVSGISSGGYMAQQFGVAYSGSIVGVGIVAGGPYQCAKGNVAIALTDCTTPTALDPPDVDYSIRATDANASQATIDQPANMRRARIWMFSGSNDKTVYPIVMDRLHDYYLHYADSSQVFYEKSIPAAHSMVTDGYGAACDHAGDANNAADTFINDCHYDAAGKLLTYILGPLNPKSKKLRGHFVEFRQDEFLADPTSHSMNATGYAYIPASCDAGAKCRVHVAFHGCLQYPDRIGDAYYKHAGYNEWADSNDLIVLYPQATASALPPVYNPKGCWDWWGYDDPAYTTRNGRQMKAVKAMIDRLGAGYVASAPAAASNLHETAATDHTISLQWSSSKGPRLAGYRIYYATPVGAPYALAGTTTATTTTVSGLASGTSYEFVVRAVSRSDQESAESPQAAGATTGLASPVPVTPVTLLIP